jgi:hypothetical protein
VPPSLAFANEVTTMRPVIEGGKGKDLVFSGKWKHVFSFALVANLLTGIHVITSTRKNFLSLML